jgi:hypothetical protein
MQMNLLGKQQNELYQDPEINFQLRLARRKDRVRLHKDFPPVLNRN